jgi:integrase/recombinase XerD
LQGIQIIDDLPFDFSVVAGSVKESSQKMYHRDFIAYLSFAGDKEQALNAAILARWRVHLTQSTSYSPNTINRMMAAVRSIMQIAAEQGYITHETAEAFSHVRGIKKGVLDERKREHARTLITTKEMGYLTSAPDLSTKLGKRDAAILHTLASSGVRISEAAKLTKDRIKYQDNNYYIEVKGKNDEDYRQAPLSIIAHDAIETWLQERDTPCPYIFTSFKNATLQSREKPMSSVALWQTVQGYAEICGLEYIKPHDFRRFVGTSIIQKHGIRKGQQVLGHKNIATTTQYDLSKLELGLTNDLY